MDALKIIPQAFFDLIARVAPGFVVLILFAWREPLAWQAIAEPMGQVAAAKPSEIPWWLLFGLAYVVGHLLSPATKLVQRVTARYPQSESRTPKSAGNWLSRWFKLDSKAYAKTLKPDSTKYDWLRVHSPEVGGIAAKLRAEFTLYNALAGVSFLFSIWSAAWHFQLIAAGVFLLVAVFMAGRGRETEETMRDCVERFYAAATTKKELAAVVHVDA